MGQWGIDFVPEVSAYRGTERTVEILTAPGNFELCGAKGLCDARPTASNFAVSGSVPPLHRRRRRDPLFVRRRLRPMCHDEDVSPKAMVHGLTD